MISCDQPQKLTHRLSTVVGGLSGFVTWLPSESRNWCTEQLSLLFFLTLTSKSLGYHIVLAVMPTGYPGPLVLLCSNSSHFFGVLRIWFSIPKYFTTFKLFENIYNGFQTFNKGMSFCLTSIFFRLNSRDVLKLSK